MTARKCWMVIEIRTYTVECEQVLEEAGFLCAVTTEAGKCSPGAAPYALPRVRMSGGQTLAEFIKKIQ